jgi:hypothetical protein
MSRLLANVRTEVLAIALVMTLRALNHAEQYFDDEVYFESGRLFVRYGRRRGGTRRDRVGLAEWSHRGSNLPSGNYAARLVRAADGSFRAQWPGVVPSG